MNIVVAVLLVFALIGYHDSGGLELTSLLYQQISL